MSRCSQCQRSLEVVGPERILFSTGYPYQYRPGRPGRFFIEGAAPSQGRCGKMVCRQGTHRPFVGGSPESWDERLPGFLRSYGRASDLLEHLSSPSDQRPTRTFERVATTYFGKSSAGLRVKTLIGLSSNSCHIVGITGQSSARGAW